MSTQMKFRLNCKYSGLQIGTLEYMTVAGHMPYLSHWNGLIALHPIFSMEQHRLLAFSRAEWNRLAKASADGETTQAEDDILSVCFLAMLHSLKGIVQEEPSLPPIHIVQSNMARLFVLAYWLHYLDSARFRFPEYKINKLNATNRFENIHHYLDACFAVKDDYERGVTELVEKEKIAAAERALATLRNSWKVPVSNRALYRWVRAHLSMKYSADGQGWMSTLFLGSEKTILEFDKDEIELLDEIITSECPVGNSIFTAVKERLQQIMKVHTDYKEAFTVDFTSYAPTTQAEVLEAPKQADFATKAAFIKANALYYLQQRATTGATL